MFKAIVLQRHGSEFDASVRDLTPLMRPASVAVLGASRAARFPRQLGS